MLTTVLGFDDESLVEGPKVPPSLVHEVAEHGEELRPDLVVLDPTTGEARLLVGGLRWQSTLEWAWLTVEADQPGEAASSHGRAGRRASRRGSRPRPASTTRSSSWRRAKCSEPWTCLG